MFYLIVTIVISIVSAIMIIAICLQEAKTGGLGGGIAGGAANAWSSKRTNSKEKRLVRITTVLAVIFFVAAILLNVGLFVNN